MKEVTVHLSETEYEWLKDQGGNNFLRHMVQWAIWLDHLTPWDRKVEDYKGAGQ
jgi:hypothetical protein